MMEPQRLKAGQGWEWIKQGYALFMKAPLLWIVLLFICFIALVVISVVPVVGNPLASLLTPVVLAGLMSGCRALEHGEDLELAHLFSGFKKSTSQLVTLGGITLVGQYLILGVMMITGGATFVSLLMSGQPEPDPNVLMAALSGAVFAVLLGTALILLLTSVMQFATLLVYFNGIPPIQAIRLTIRAFLYNIWPLLVFGMTFFLLAILATLLMGLGWLVLFPMSFPSLYVIYRAIFPPVKEGNSAPANVKDAFTPDKDVF
jgi:hypothetical protein